MFGRIGLEDIDFFFSLVIAITLGGDTGGKVERFFVNLSHDVFKLYRVYL